jgi:hypothetical protein
MHSILAPIDANPVVLIVTNHIQDGPLLFLAILARRSPSSGYLTSGSGVTPD